MCSVLAMENWLKQSFSVLEMHFWCYDGLVRGGRSDECVTVLGCRLCVEIMGKGCISFSRSASCKSVGGNIM